jgi:adenylate cyclase
VPIAEELAQQVDDVLNQSWDIRDGQVVPNTENVALAGGGVRLTATMLYSDLADSTELAMWDRRVASRVCKAFLECVTRLIRARGGDVRSFDGDRVMGVFVGDNKNTAAVRCALQINWMFTQLLNPKFNAKYAKLADGTYKLAHCTGVDVGLAEPGKRARASLICAARNLKNSDDGQSAF